MANNMYAERPKGNFGASLFGSLIVVLTAVAALAAYWTLTGRSLPLPAPDNPAAPENMAVLGVMGLILIGAVAFVTMVWNSLTKAFSDHYSTPARIYTIFTLVAALISGYTTTYGVVIEFLDPAQGFIRYRLFPVVVFLYAFLFVYLTWSWTFDLIVRKEAEGAGAKRTNRIAVGLLVPLIAAAPIFALSTTTSALGLAGPRILERSLLGWMDDYSRSIRSLDGYIQEAGAVSLGLESLSDRMESLAAQEAATGAISGFAGQGSVTAQLRSAAADLDNTAALVSREQTARLGEADELAQDLSRARATVLDGQFFIDANGDPLPVRDWQDNARGLERELGAQWERAASRAHIRAASSQLQLVDRLIFGGAVSNSSVVANAQQNARGQISAYLAEARDVVQSDMRDALSAETPQPPEFTYRSPLIVLFSRWQEAILPWVIAISVDFGPWVWIMLTLIAGFDSADRSRALHRHEYGDRQNA